MAQRQTGSRLTFYPSTVGIRHPTQSGPLISPNLGRLLELQRAAGNRAVSQALLHLKTFQKNPRANQVTVQRRLPTAEMLRPTIESQGWEVISVQLLALFNMMLHKKELHKASGDLYDSVGEAMQDIQTDGQFNGVAYQAIYNKSSQYARLLAAKQSLSSEHWTRLQPLVGVAAKLALQASTEYGILWKVFGPKVRAEVVPIFEATAKGLLEYKKESFETDYNRDMEAMRVAGASSPGSKKILLSASSLSKGDAVLIETLVHEATHETSGTEDLGYIGSGGFSALSEKRKAKNADHYTEVIARLLGTSADAGKQYQPREGVRTGAEGIGAKKQKLASDGLERLWNFTASLQSVCRDIASGVRPPVGSSEDKALVRKIKTAYELPQSMTYVDISAMDVAMLESFAYVFSKAQDNVAEKENLRVESLALNAITKVGGLSGLGRDNDKVILYKIRVLHLDLHQTDPLSE